MWKLWPMWCQAPSIQAFEQICPNSGRFLWPYTLGSPDIAPRIGHQIALDHMPLPGLTVIRIWGHYRCRVRMFSSYFKKDCRRVRDILEPPLHAEGCPASTDRNSLSSSCSAPRRQTKNLRSLCSLRNPTRVCLSLR